MIAPKNSNTIKLCFVKKISSSLSLNNFMTIKNEIKPMFILVAALPIIKVIGIKKLK